MTKVVIGNATLYKGDAREILPTLGPVDVLCTDAPYKITSGGPSGLLGGWIGSAEYSNSGSPVVCDIEWADWLGLAFDCLTERAHAYIFTNDREMQKARGAAEAAGFYFHRLLVWDKRSASPNRWYQQVCEFVLFMKKGNAFRIANPSSKSLYSEFQKDVTAHETEKPVNLCRHYIENSTNPGGIVLDPFMGSGTTGVAAIETGRSFVGIELTDKWFDVACERIARAEPLVSLSMLPKGVAGQVSFLTDEVGA